MGIEQLARVFSPDLKGAAPGPTVTLSRQQIEFYHSEGYLSLPRLMTAKEVQWLRGIYDRLFATRAGRAEGNQFDLGGADEEGMNSFSNRIASSGGFHCRRLLFLPS